MQDWGAVRWGMLPSRRRNIFEFAIVALCVILEARVLPCVFEIVCDCLSICSECSHLYFELFVVACDRFQFASVVCSGFGEMSASIGIHPGYWQSDRHGWSDCGIWAMFGIFSHIRDIS